MFNTLIHFDEQRELDMSGDLFTWSNNHEFPTYQVVGKKTSILMSWLRNSIEKFQTTTLSSF